MVSNKNMYDPEAALHELQLQEQIFKARLDTQVILQLLIKNGLVTQEQLQDYRDKIIENNQGFKATKESIDAQRKVFEKAQNNPEEYLKSLLKAKLEGKIK